jgi:predicted acyl esterase
VERGFHVICQDVRGRFESTGTFTMGENEKRDARCTLKWLAQQPWHDGRVAFCGISIGGYSTWCSVAGALEFLNVVNLKKDVEMGNESSHKLEICAILPFCSSSDIIRSGMLHEGGGHPDAIIKLDIVTKYSHFMHRLQKTKHILGSYLLFVVYRALEMAWKFKSNRFAAGQRYLPLKDIDEAVIGETPLVRFQIKTETTDPFWKDLNQTWAVEWVGDPQGSLCPDPENPPHLHLVSGWYDVFAQETINDYIRAHRSSENARKNGRCGNENIFLTIGPWTHFDTYYFLCMREAIASLEARLEDSSTLSGCDKNDPSIPRCMMFCLNAGKRWRHKLSIFEKIEAEMYPSTSINASSSPNNPNWRYFSEYPPSGTKESILHLDVGKTLKYRKSGDKVAEAVDQKATESLRYDPENPTPTLGGAIFDMLEAGPRFQEEFERRDDVLVFTSSPLRYPIEIAGKVMLHVRVSSSAPSCDVYGALCVVEDVEGEHDESVALTQGVKRVTPKYENNPTFPLDVDVNLGFTCARFEAGQRIRLQIAGGSFPLYSRNLGFGEPSETAIKMQHQVNTIFLAHCSLSLPISVGKIVFGVQQTLPSPSI